MKVLHIIDHDGHGGAQTLLKNYFEIKKNNREIFYVALRKNREGGVVIGHKNTFVFPGRFKWDFRSIPWIIGIIREKNINILHCHLEKSILFGIFIKIFFKGKIKVIAHEHGGVLFSGFSRIIFRIFGRCIDAIISVSKEVSRVLLLQKISQEKIFTVSNFIFTSKSNDFLKKNNKNTIGFLGRISHEKGLDIAITAMSFLLSETRLLIAGDGAESGKNKELARKLKLEKRIFFLGRVQNLEAFFEQIDILVVPSRSESFGLSAVEAQVFDTPVVATTVGGLPETLGESVLFCDPENPQDLAEKIKMLMKDSEKREKLIFWGRGNAKRFSFEIFEKKIKRIYQALP